MTRSYYTSMKKQFVFTVAVICLLFLLWSFGTSVLQTGSQLFVLEEVESPRRTCPNVLEQMVVGNWHKREFSQQEEKEVRNFHSRIRAFHWIPQGLQRSDRLCGNLHYEGKVKPWNGFNYFRALCNPDGDTPCCYDNKCVARSIKDCRCPNCYDVRQQIHAELSTWVPSNPTCKMRLFKDDKDMCRVLSGVTIYFIGDSFVRQLFISLISLIRIHTPNGPLIDDAPADLRQKCDRLYTIGSTECILITLNETRECLNSTYLRKERFHSTEEYADVLFTIKQLIGKPDTFIIFNAGIHQQFDHKIVEKEIINPILTLLSNFSWPKPIWLSTHSTGLLKAPFYKSQQESDVVNFNAKFNVLLKKRGVAVLDFHNMTKNVMSYDGTHYGAGVNEIKAQILINYIMEVRANQTVSDISQRK